MYYCYLDTPIGELLVAGDDDGLYQIGFPKGSMRREPRADWIFNEGRLEEARRQLSEYFAGERRSFDLPVQLTARDSLRGDRHLRRHREADRPAEGGARGRCGERTESAADCRALPSRHRQHR
jgi:hypothetical protein